jgi:hypothetical protein
VIQDLSESLPRERSDGMVLDQRAVIEHRNAMTCTVKKSACECLPVPADARRESGKSGTYNDLYVI